MFANYNQQGDQSWMSDGGSRIQLMQEVLPRLYLGGSKAAENLEGLRSSNISFVLSINHHELPRPIREVYRKTRTAHVRISKEDRREEDLLSILEAVCDVIEGQLAKGKAVLVHCAKGISRSATVVIAYVMRKLHMSYRGALVFVRMKRPVVNPNPAFREQLQLWENCGFDIQNLSPGCQVRSQSAGTSCMVEGKEGTEKGEKEGSKELELGQEGKKEDQMRMGAVEPNEEEDKDEENKLGGDEGKESKPDETSVEDRAKHSKSRHNYRTGTTRQWIYLVASALSKGFSKAFGDIKNTLSHSTDAIPTEPAPPSHFTESITTAFKSRYLKYLAMRKKVVRIFQGHGWSITETGIWFHLEIIVAEYNPEGTGTGTE